MVSGGFFGLPLLEPVFTSVSTCLFGKFCCILREKYLPGDSPPAYFCLVCNKIMLENPHIFLVKIDSYFSEGTAYRLVSHAGMYS